MIILQVLQKLHQPLQQRFQLAIQQSYTIGNFCPIQSMSIKVYQEVKSVLSPVHPW